MAGTVAVVGSGIVGSALAYHLTRAGHRVTVFEKGKDYPYPHRRQFEEQVLNLYQNPAYTLGRDLDDMEVSGRYGLDLKAERYLLLGGQATHWAAICLRMRPSDFRTRSAHGFGADWPIEYADLEPYYGKAEQYLSVSGTDDDNPFAPPRSTPFPLPAFELTHDDRLIAERLAKHGIVLHTTAQARPSRPHGDRAVCQNFGVCTVCPIGARYSPYHHLGKAVATGLCEVKVETSVRRIVTDESGRARAVLYRGNDDSSDREFPADYVVVAGGAIESARLLLLSSDDQSPRGLGHESGQVGRNLLFHHCYWTGLSYTEKRYPDRFGGWSGQSHQFVEPEQRGDHGGVKVEFTSRPAGGHARSWGDRESMLAEIGKRLTTREIEFQAETIPSDDKFVQLGKREDRFGDAFAHVQYQPCAFDERTHAYASQIHDRFVEATGAEPSSLPDDPNRYSSGAHHMGGCRMSERAGDGVVDRFGKVHSSPNLYVLGSSNFVMSSAMNPTLTIVALALRASEHLLERLGPA